MPKRLFMMAILLSDHKKINGQMHGLFKTLYLRTKSPKNTNRLVYLFSHFSGVKPIFATPHVANPSGASTSLRACFRRQKILGYTAI